MSLQHLLTTVLLLACGNAMAGVTAERTRVIFPQGQREVSLVLANQNDYPVMVQTWVDDGDPNSGPDEAQSPVIPLPAMFQLAAGQRQSLRLLYVGPSPAEDRESLYWLNLLEIPPNRLDGEEPDPTRLTVTMRTQMKLIYRPAALKAGAGQPAAKLRFRLEDGHLFAANTTPYYITLSGITLCGGQPAPVANEGLLAPQSDTRIADSAPACVQQDPSLQFTWIDDEGNNQAGRATLSAK
jgi:P pilus assembly chaperone PapD